MNKKALPLYVFSFIMIMPFHALFPLLPSIRDEIGASYSQISIFLASLGVVRLSMAVPSGLLADHYNKKKVLLFSGVLCLGGLLAMSFAHSFSLLIVSRVLIGFSSIVCNITILALLAQLAGSSGRGTMMSMNNVVHNAGGIISPALAGFLAKWYGWRVSFLAIAGLIVLSMAVITLFFNLQATPGEHEGKTQRAGSGISPSMIVKSWGTRLVPIFALGFFVFFYRGYFRHTLLPFFGKDVFQIQVDTLGMYFSLTAGIAIVSLIALGHLSDRLGRKTAVLPGIFFSTVAALLLLLPPSANPLLICCIFVGLGAVINSMPNVLISDIVPPEVYGRVMGLNRMFADSGYFVGTLAAGVLLDQFGFKIPLYWIAAYAAVMMAVISFTVSSKPPDG
ncbi:MAG: MFS transporter [Deltaproteobacteria bacterium]|nr:MFS transporter [Deltaproteobacteria bacterium]